MADSVSKLADWVRMSLIFGAASTRAVQLLAEYDTPDAVLSAMEQGEIGALTPVVVKNFQKYNRSQAESIVYFCEKNDIALITPDDELYPEDLCHISAPPMLLTAKGNLNLLQKNVSVTVVGTRHPSDYSTNVASTMVQNLAAAGFQIVSGFAMGIDKVVHEAALDAGGTTIGVLGCGINVNYPRENDKLRTKLLESGNGLLVSEYLPGVQPVPANFPRRNRILSGLTNGTIVIEAAMHSGSLVTAEYAASQGKYLFCVPPHDLFDPRYAGVIPFLRDGAIGIYSHRDVLYCLYRDLPMKVFYESTVLSPKESLVFADRQAEPQPAPRKRTESQMNAEYAEEATALEDEDTAEPQPLPEDETEAKVVAFLREKGQIHVNTLAEALDMEMSALLSTLTVLELDGYVESVFGKQYRAL